MQLTGSRPRIGWRSTVAGRAPNRSGARRLRRGADARLDPHLVDVVAPAREHAHAVAGGEDRVEVLGQRVPREPLEHALAHLRSPAAASSVTRVTAPSAPSPTTSPSKSGSPRRAATSSPLGRHELERGDRGREVAVAVAGPVRGRRDGAGDGDVGQRGEVVQRQAAGGERLGELAVADRAAARHGARGGVDGDVARAAPRARRARRASAMPLNEWRDPSTRIRGARAASTSRSCSSVSGGARRPPGRRGSRPSCAALGHHGWDMAPDAFTSGGRAPSGRRPAARAPRRRLAARARGEDPHTVALVLEGGGMRGVVSAGMTAALERLGPHAVLRPRGRRVGGRDQRRGAAGRRRAARRRDLPRAARVARVRQPGADPARAAGDRRQPDPRLRVRRARRGPPRARPGEPDRAALRRRRGRHRAAGGHHRDAHEARAVGRDPRLQPDAARRRAAGGDRRAALHRRRHGRADPGRRGDRRRGDARAGAADAALRRAAPERVAARRPADRAPPARAQPGAGRRSTARASPPTSGWSTTSRGARSTRARRRPTCSGCARPRARPASASSSAAPRSWRARRSTRSGSSSARCRRGRGSGPRRA